MGLFPLSPLFSRPFFGAVHKARSAPFSGRYFVPSATRGSARYQHNVHHEQVAQRCRVAMAAQAIKRPSMSRQLLKIGFAGLGLGMTFLAAPIIYCDPVTSKTAPAAAVPPATQGKTAPVQPSPPPPPPPASSVSYYELTFGTVCGVCAGIFVKKGAKAVAFVMGGVFVLLQYLGSLSLVRVDWGRAASRFENLFYTKDGSGARRPPNVGSLFRWIIDFLTADFQQRASFVAGFGLGLRIG
ncbi:FUN14 family-domain-containing protein [Trametes gibbosa]|nr:FUN14 family-domain-containing protein [Trametes gibbosa]